MRAKPLSLLPQAKAHLALRVAQVGQELIQL